MSKTIEQMMEGLQDPMMQEKAARYQNARDAVAWAYKMAQEIYSLPGAVDLSAASISTYARQLTPLIEADLNKTLDVLKESDGTKS